MTGSNWFEKFMTSKQLFISHPRSNHYGPKCRIHTHKRYAILTRTHRSDTNTKRQKNKYLISFQRLFQNSDTQEGISKASNKRNRKHDICIEEDKVSLKTQIDLF
jgi:hypothetical protein